MTYETRFRAFAENACIEEKTARYDDKREAELTKRGEAAAFSRMIPDAKEADAQITALTERLRAVEAERDSYKTRAQVAESSINRAMGAAHDSMPEYPWNTMRKGEELATACWAWASALKGTRQACDDMHATNSALRAELERKDAALRKYADSANYSNGYYGEVTWCGAMDGEEDAPWNIARAALQPKEPPCQTA